MSGAQSPRFFLSTVLATAKDRRQALAAAAVSAAVFAACVPFARIQLAQVWPFIPIYQSALIVCDLVTALLLFAQFAILRSRSILSIAAGYFFTASMAAAHMLSFPGLFSPTGLLGAGPQTTAWLYMAWHSGFPLAVTAYAVAKRQERLGMQPVRRPVLAAGAAIGGVTIVAGVLTLAATIRHDWLPAVMLGNHYAPAMLGTVTTVWGLSIAALVVLGLSRPHTVFDLWLILVAVASIADIGLAAAFNAGRFDFGFYAGRVFGLLAASYILVGLLLETGSLYVRTSEQREERLRELQDELIHVARLNELGQLVSALAHELNQPLAAAINYLGAAQQMAGATNPGPTWQVIQKASDQITRAAQIIERLRRLAARGEVERQPENLSSTIEEVVSLVSSHSSLEGVSIRVSVDPATSVRIDRVQVQQVLLNLIRNSVQAMADSPSRQIVISSAPGAEGLVEVSVADTGAGLPPQVRESLFRPFVSSRSGGMGVGLSICRSIVDAHNGRIWALDNPGAGTIFRFTLEAA